MERKRPRLRRIFRTGGSREWHIIVLSVIAILVLALLGFGFSSAVKEQFFTERRFNLINISSEISMQMDSEFAAVISDCDNTDYLLHFFADYQSEAYYAMIDLAASLQSICCRARAESRDLMLLFDEENQYYASDGSIGHWTETELFRRVSDGETMLQSTLPFRPAAENYLLFFRKLDAPLQFENLDKKIVYFAICVNTESLRSCIDIHGFRGENFAYVVSGDGHRLFRFEQGDSFIDSYNIVTLLQGTEVVQGNSWAEVLNCISAGETACTEFRYEDMNYFLATVPLTYASWNILEFVPTAVLGENSNNFLRIMLIYFVLAAVVLVALFLLLFFFMTTTVNARRFAAQEQENSRKMAEIAQKAESASEAKTMFLSNMSHDIRTPINGIMGMTSIALGHLDERERVKDCLTKIDGASQHLLSLVNDVLDMSRIESGKTTMTHEPLDMRTVGANCASIVRGQLSDRAINFVTEFPEPQNPHVIGDELHIRQVLINILGNAIKFTPDGGTITFRMWEAGGEEGKTSYVYQVADTGIGMKAEFLEHIWEAFSQEEGGSRTNYKGTGLGMAITKQFVELMGGEIAVESELNVGSTFTVTLPFVIDDAPREEAAVTAAESLEGVKALLVEDNELNREIATELLEEEGMVITCAEDGQEAVDAFTGNPPGTFDLILMDVMMPVMDGLEATRTIRAFDRPDAKTIPIIAMTANAFEEDVRRTRDAGMNAHLSKPLDLALVLKTLAAFIER